MKLDGLAPILIGCGHRAANVRLRVANRPKGDMLISFRPSGADQVRSTGERGLPAIFPKLFKLNGNGLVPAQAGRFLADGGMGQ